MAKAMNIRGIDEQVMRDFSSGAHLRGITQAEYLARLIALRRFVDHEVTETMDEDLDVRADIAPQTVNNIFAFLVDKGLYSRSV